MAHSGTTADSFIGRTAELDLLSRCIDADQGPRLIAIHGEAGVGKSRLAQEFERLLADRGISVAWGRWYEAPGMRPYAGFVETLQGLRSGLQAKASKELVGRLTQSERRLLGVHIDEEPGSTSPSEDSHAFFEAVAQPLLETGSASPFIVALDDVHWADEASLGLLMHLARRASAGGGPLLLALWREEQALPGTPLYDAIEALRRERLIVDLPVSGLDAQETGQLVSRLLGRPAPDEAGRRLHEVTRGNPLFIREIVRHSAESGYLNELVSPPPAPAWGLSELPRTVSEMIRLRLAKVGPAVREALSLLSVLGREFEIGVLRHCGLLTEEQLAQTVPEAIRLGFLAERRRGLDTLLAFSHPLVGAVLYYSLDPVTRAALHRRVGVALEATVGGHHESEVAHHLIEGQQPEDRARALGYQVDAARRARAALAYQEARRLWRRAFQLLDAGLPVTDPERRLYTREYADTCSMAGYPDEALSLYGRLLAGLGPNGDPREVAELNGAIGWTLHNHGRRSEAAQYLERALPPPDAVPSPQIAALLAVHAVGLMSAGRLTEGRPYLDRALEMIREHPEIESDGIVCQMGMVWHTWDPGGDPSLVPSLIDAAKRFHDGQGNVWSGTRVQLDGAVSYFFFGEWERSQRLLASAVESSRRIGATMLAADAVAFRSYVNTIGGDFRAADEDIARCEGHLQAASTSIYSEGLRRGLALRHFWQGRAAEARAEVEKVDSFLNASLEPHLRLAEGDREGASAAVAAIAPMVPADGHGGVWLMFALSCASALCTLDRSTEAAQWYEALERQKAWHMDWWQPQIELGRIAAGNRWWRRAFDHFEAAVRRFDDLGWRPWAATARLEYAEARARHHNLGDRARAIELLDGALPLFEELGMAPYAERARALHSALDPGRPMSPGPAHLSPQELRVLKGIVEGLSNLEIARQLSVGERTVETHVSHIFMKLEVSSRAAAVAEALRHHLV